MHNHSATSPDQGSTFFSLKIKFIWHECRRSEELMVFLLPSMHVLWTELRLALSFAASFTSWVLLLPQHSSLSLGVERPHADICSFGTCDTFGATDECMWHFYKVAIIDGLISSECGKNEDIPGMGAWQTWTVVNCLSHPCYVEGHLATSVDSMGAWLGL